VTTLRSFYTIGHSTRSIDEFVALLEPYDIKLVVDVRTLARSRTNPQYNAEQFAKAMAEFHIDYNHIKSLGGLRRRSRDVPPNVNAFWKNPRFHNYADYATSVEFRSGLARLRDLGHDSTCTIMCAEAVWWRCHRRIIADYLIVSGETVFHILGPRKIVPARLTGGATLRADGALTYPLAEL
jgi:uncharacterized protein (DUF488 family)